MQLGRFTRPLALSLILVACSSSPPAEEGAAIDINSAESGSESGADSVGSIPEDMIEGQPADPFADLAEAEKSSDAAKSEDSGALAVIEGNAEEVTQSGSGNYETYTVKSGDTLMKIAFSLYGDVSRWKDLMDLNGDKISKSNSLKRGTKLKYEAPLEPFQQEILGHSYEIKSGDTLAGIADEVYGKRSKYKKLQSYNSKLVRNPNRIYAGFTLYYDINEQEMAEAEARRQQRMASGSSNAGGEGTRSNSSSAVQAVPAPAVPEAPASLIPSAVSPIPEAVPPPAPPVATAPGALGPEAPAPQ